MGPQGCLGSRVGGGSSPRSRTGRSGCIASPANLLAAVGDATAGGVEGVALGCLNAAEAGEAVLELHEVMSRLKGLQLALLAHADQLEVSAQADGVRRR